MLNIAIPMWVLLAVAGLPTMILLMLSLRLMRLKRYKKRAPGRPSNDIALPDADFEGFGKQMDQMILEQQIDSVFGALSTIIETERIKLKALLGRASGDVSHRTYNEVLAKEPNPSAHRYEETATTVSGSKNERPTIAEMVADGKTPEEIARLLGLSQTEAALAIKIHGGRRGKRLEAVA